MKKVRIDVGNNITIKVSAEFKNLAEGLVKHDIGFVDICRVGKEFEIAFVGAESLSAFFELLAEAGDEKTLRKIFRKKSMVSCSTFVDLWKPKKKAEGHHEVCITSYVNLPMECLPHVAFTMNFIGDVANSILSIIPKESN